MNTYDSASWAILLLICFVLPASLLLAWNLKGIFRWAWFVFVGNAAVIATALVSRVGRLRGDPDFLISARSLVLLLGLGLEAFGLCVWLLVGFTRDYPERTERKP